MIYMDCIFEKNTMLRERNDGRFTVAWDMDNTLVDDFGGKTRPGVKKCLKGLRSKHIKMVVWTNSEKKRAQDILKDRGLEPYFHALITRESYELSEIQKRNPDFHKKIAAAFPREVAFQNKFESGKNISLLGYDVLIDDNPDVAQQAVCWNHAYHVEVCERYSGRAPLLFNGQIERITNKIIKMAQPTIWQWIGIAR